MRKFLASAIQLDSQGSKMENLKNIYSLVEEAALKGARLIALPESANYDGTDFKAAAEEIPGGETFELMSYLAQKHGVWLHCGSIYEKNDDDGRPYNCTMVINPQGELAAKYRKTHLFDIKLENSGLCVRESDNICPGNEIVTIDTGEVGVLGLSICYDIRFGEMFRLMALDGAEIFVTPADFTMNTGKDHWEAVLRTRAIENGCYVIAPNQIGQKPKFNSYGNTMIIDPWGTVIARASDKVGIVMAEIDLDYAEKVRKQVFTLENRREDLYSLKRSK